MLSILSRQCNAEGSSAVLSWQQFPWDRGLVVFVRMCPSVRICGRITVW